MPISPSHNLKSAKDRKPKRTRFSNLTIDEYAITEDVVAKVYVDICNCVSKSDTLEKITSGIYGNKPCTKRNAYYYYNAALARLQEDRDHEQEDLKNIFYARYETLLADAIEVGDRSTAKGILDSMYKFFVGEPKNQTNVQINGKDDGKIEINFGFPSDS